MKDQNSKTERPIRATNKPKNQQNRSAGEDQNGRKAGADSGDMLNEGEVLLPAWIRRVSYPVLKRADGTEYIIVDGEEQSLQELRSQFERQRRPLSPKVLELCFGQSFGQSGTDPQSQKPGSVQRHNLFASILKRARQKISRIGRELEYRFALGKAHFSRGRRRMPWDTLFQDNRPSPPTTKIPQTTLSQVYYCPRKDI